MTTNVSGLDHETLISGAMAKEYYAYQRMQTNKTEAENKQTAIETISSAFTSFRTVAKQVKNSDTLNTFSVNSSSSVASVTSTGGGVEGISKLEVGQLAQSAKMVMNTGYDSSSTKVGSGGSISTAQSATSVANSDTEPYITTGSEISVYEIQFGEEDKISITLEADQSYTLDEVVELINEQSQATSSYDAAAVSGDGPYSLQLSARNRGETGEVIITKSEGSDIEAFEDFTTTDGTDPSDGQISYTYNGETRTIYTLGDTSLDDLVGYINDDAENPGVRASVLRYDDSYHLVLSGENTGGDYTIEIDDENTTLENISNDNFTVSQTAQDAHYRVDGFPKEPNWLNSSSNTVSDAIPGVSFSLMETGEATISQTRSFDYLKANLTSLVDTYNALKDTIDYYIGYNAEAEEGGLLQGDSTVRYMLEPITNYMVNMTKGFDENDEVNMLYDLGIEINADGQLELDSDKLDDALENNFESVMSYLSADNKGETSSVNFQYLSSLDSTEPGSYDIKVEYDSDGNITSAQIKNKGDDDDQWHDASFDGDVISGEVGTPEAGVEIKVVWDGTSSVQTATLDLKDGIGATLFDLVDDYLSTTGPLETSIESYESQAEELAEKMETELTRIESVEERLTAQFSRMEATLATYQGMEAQFTALINSLEIMDSDD